MTDAGLQTRLEIEETSLLEQSPNHNSADNPVSDEEKQQTLVVS